VSGPAITDFLAGMVTAGFLACGLFFARFWRRSGDFLFLAFASAFWLLALNAAVATFVPELDERRAWFYLLRVAAFLLIALAIVRKNIND
jgi:uncharacterized membrane protein YbhN (UPF0104 family)